ncbi:MAG: D-sedoheptulose-7-phosphate isomerase [Candidatus Acidiferrales bacterium]
MGDLTKKIREQLEESARVRERFSAELVEKIARLAETSARAIRDGRKMLLFGNGGSAADAQHIAAELVVRLQRERPGIAAVALTTNTSILTAAGNDYGFEKIFSRQIETLAAEGDILVALSTSGNSANVVRGAEAGRARGAWIAAMTGETGGALGAKADVLINVPSRDAQRIQEAHITIGHIVCALIEDLVHS